jgi:HK97 family phage prohead protease
MTTRETRLWRGTTVELRARSEGLPTITGYGAVFNRLSQNLGGFVEDIDPGAFTDTLARNNDVKSYWNHDGSRFLGRRSASNFTVSVDGTGLPYEVTPPNTTYARDLVEVISAGLVLGSSFTFRTLVDGDTWTLTEQGFPKRTLLAVELFETGPVSDPAYLATETEGSSVALRSLAARLNRPFAEVNEAAVANELRNVMTPKGAPELEEQAERTVNRIEWNRRRLALAAHRI